MSGEAKEDPAHIIWECDAFCQRRLEVFNFLEWHPEMEWTVDQMMRFLNKTRVRNLEEDDDSDNQTILILNLCCMFHRGRGLPLLGVPSPTHQSGVQLNMPQSRVWPTARASLLFYSIPSYYVRASLFTLVCVLTVHRKNKSD